MSFFSIQEIIFLSVMIACSGVASIVGYINRKKFNYLRFFYLYPTLSFLFTSVCLIQSFNVTDYSKFSAMVIQGTRIFLVVEFLFIYAFFLAIINSRRMKFALYIIAVLYLLLAFYLSFFIYGLPLYPKFLYAYQSIAILFPTGYYFVHVMKKEFSTEFQKDPDFWISMGLLVYFGGTLPLFLLLDFALDEIGLVLSSVYLINHIAYSVLFLLIAKAYRCPLKNRSRD